MTSEMQISLGLHPTGMGAERRVRLFLNQSSGVGDLQPDELCRRFKARGVDCEMTQLDDDIQLPELAERDDAGVVWVAGGGDGTVNAIARIVAGTERAMAVLPCGTLNHFARDLRIPLDLDAAIEVAAICPWRRVDAAEVNGVVFVNNSGLGVYPAMVFDRERMKKGGGNKWFALAVASARAFVRFRSLHVELEVDGTQQEYKTPLIFIGNNPYVIEGGSLGCRERVDTGRLALYLVPGATRAGLLRLLIGALTGRLRGAKELVEFTADHFTVRAKRRRLRVSFDGEVRRMVPPLVYKALPGALRVIAPPVEATVGAA